MKKNIFLSNTQNRRLISSGPNQRSSFSGSDSQHNNSKKILCYNVLNNKACNYGHKCMYAHNLSEQKKDPIRHKVYTILRNNNDLTDLDLMNDDKLFNAFIELTKVCSNCIKKTCPGGYNCRYGAINMKYKVCYEDFIYGNCMRYNCYSMHLTERGLVSYTAQKAKKNRTNVQSQKNGYAKNNIKKENVKIFKKNIGAWGNVPKSLYSTENIVKDDQVLESEHLCDQLSEPEHPGDQLSEFKPKLPKNTILNALTSLNSKNNKGKVKKNSYSVISNRNLNNTPGVLLTEKFLMSHFTRKPDVIYISSDSEDIDDNIEDMIEYLNRESDDSSYEESIFAD